MQISDFVPSLSRHAKVTFIVPMDHKRMKVLDHQKLDGVQVIPVPLSGMGKYFGIARALFRHARKADRVYTRSPKAARMASVLTPAPITVELHEQLSPGMDRALRQNQKISLITINQSQYDGLVADGGERVSYCPLSSSGWDVSYAAEPVYDLGYAGSSSPGKGVERLIEAGRARPGLRILLICNMSKELRASLPANIEVTGFLPHDQVGPRLTQVRYLVAPYEKRIFGAGGQVDISGTMSPLKIFEYMSLGRPIIASDVPAVSSLLGELGIYFEPGSTESLLKAVDAAAKSAPNLGSMLQARWKKTYSTEARAQQLVDGWRK